MSEPNANYAAPRSAAATKRADAIRGVLVALIVLGAGVYAFYLLQFLGGILGLFGPVWAVAPPTLMLVLGIAGSRAQLQELWQRRDALRAFLFGGSAWWHGPIFALRHRVFGRAVPEYPDTRQRELRLPACEKPASRSSSQMASS